MLDGDYASGCPALEKSYELDPLPGALFTLAACFERWGKVQTAVKRYEEFVASQEAADFSSLPEDKRTRAEERLAESRAKVEELKPRIPTITISLSFGDEGATLTIDGVAAQPGKPSSVEAGEHAVVAVAPDGRRAEKTVGIEAGQKLVVSLELGAPAPLPAPKPTGDPGMSGFMIGGIAASVVGVAGLAIGGITGGLVFSKKSDVDEQCVDFVCTPAGKSAVDDAQSLGLVSTISFAVGGAGAAAALILFLVDPSDEEDATEVARSLSFGVMPGGASLGWGGTF